MKAYVKARPVIRHKFNSDNMSCDNVLKISMICTDCFKTELSHRLVNKYYKEDIRCYICVLFQPLIYIRLNFIKTNAAWQISYYEW